jgi:hypothetical protein
MDALILDTTGEDFGKHAYSQMAEFNVEVETREVKLVDVPGVISRSDAESYLVICDVEERFIEEVIDKVLELEMRKGVIEKLFLDSEGESQEVFRRRARREAGEAAERLAEKIR